MTVHIKSSTSFAWLSERGLASIRNGGIFKDAANREARTRGSEVNLQPNKSTANGTMSFGRTPGVECYLYLLPKPEDSGSSDTGGNLHSTEFRPAIIVAILMWNVFREFFQFCAREKKWWLLPLVILLLVLAVVLIFATSSGIVWSLYPF
jgi:hypothetical protein